MSLIKSNMILSEVVEQNPSLIPVINRFNIHLGLGDTRIQEICAKEEIDSEFFLAVINTFLNDEYFPEKKLLAFNASQIVDYLDKTNQYYLKFQLPNIERHLNSFIHSSGNPSLLPIQKFVLKFREELTKRIEKDETELFPYCLEANNEIIAQAAERILNETQKECKTEHEDTIEALLNDLNSIMIKHISGNFDENLCYAVIFGIYSLAKDIKQHNRIRYRILYPMVRAIKVYQHKQH